MLLTSRIRRRQATSAGHRMRREGLQHLIITTGEIGKKTVHGKTEGTNIRQSSSLDEYRKDDICNFSNQRSRCSERNDLQNRVTEDQNTVIIKDNTLLHKTFRWHEKDFFRALLLEQRVLYARLSYLSLGLSDRQSLRSLQTNVCLLLLKDGTSVIESNAFCEHGGVHACTCVCVCV